MWNPETLALIAATFAFAGIVKGVIGLGVPVIVTALLGPMLGLKTAIALMLIPSLAMNSWLAVSGGALPALVRRLWPMLLLAIPGIWIGVSLLKTDDTRLLLSVLSVVLIIFATLSLTRYRLRPPGPWEPFLSPVVGLSAGLLFGMVGNFMVPGVMFLQSLGLPRDRLVQALGMTFLLISITLLTFLSQADLLSKDLVIVSAGAIVPALLGMVIGQWLRPRLSEDWFRKLFAIGLLIAGISILIHAQLKA